MNASSLHRRAGWASVLTAALLLVSCSASTQMAVPGDADTTTQPTAPATEPTTQPTEPAAPATKPAGPTVEIAADRAGTSDVQFDAAFASLLAQTELRAEALGLGTVTGVPEEGLIWVELPDGFDQTEVTEAFSDSGGLTFRPICALVEPHDPSVEAVALQTLVGDGSLCEASLAGSANAVPTTLPGEITPASAILLPAPAAPNGRYYLGPMVVGSGAVESAEAIDRDSYYTISLVMKDGADGIDQFNIAAADCAVRSSVCSSGQLAALVDAMVVTAPNVNASSFARDEIEITGNFTQQDAEWLAMVINAATLTVTVTIIE